MKPIRLLLLVSILLLTLGAACTPRSGAQAQLPEATPASAEPAAGVSDYEQLLAALRADGLSVEASGAVEDPFFSGDAYAIAVAGAQVSVYQFTDESAAAAAAATVNATGTIIGTIIVDWAEPPHFYRQGRLVALYAGENETVLEALASALGQPFVVGEGLFGPLPDTTGSPAPPEPVALAVRSLEVEVGVGSPLPVDVTFYADWPSLCAQLASVTQEVSAFRFDITVFAHPGPADCTPDFVGLGYRLSLPINIVELPEGTYTVTVNGLETTFDVPVGIPVGDSAPPQDGGTALCPEVPRPALALFVAGEGYILADPDSDARCQTTLAGDIPGRFVVGGETVFYPVRETGPVESQLAGDHFFIRQVSADGAAFTLPFTAVPFEEAKLGYDLAGGQGLLAWSAGRVPDDNLEVALSQIWLADLATGDVWTPLPESRVGRAAAADFYRMLAPIRFSADGNVLYYTLKPVITDRLWNSYSGRYDNVYALRLRSEAPPELIFDCGEQGLTLCIGDFQEVGGEVVALAYVNADNALVIRNGAGETVNTIAVADDYVGSPLFGPGGELVFYGAEIQGDPAVSLAPARGTLYRVAPPTAQAEVLAQSPGLRFPRAWFGPERVVVDFAQGVDGWGTALVGLDGELAIMALEAAATFVEVLPASGPVDG